MTKPDTVLQDSTLRLGYLVAIAPPSTSAFTTDEIDTVQRHVELAKVGLLYRGPHGNWLAAPAAWSPALWAAVLRRARSQPRELCGALLALLRPSTKSPRGMLVALRAALAACFLTEVVKVDLVHCQFGGPAAAGAFVWHRLTGVPYTVRAHAYEIYEPYGWAGRVFSEADRVIAISDHGAQEISRRWGVESSVVRVGVPLGTIGRRPNRALGEPPKLLSVGNLVAKKGHEVVIQAVTTLAQAGRPVTLDVIGEGPLRSKLEAMAPANVRFHGALPSDVVRAAYKDHDLFVMGSRVAGKGDRDGIPVVLMEAAAAGLPIVATPVGGIPELVEDGVSGRLVESDPGALARAIIAALDDYEAALAFAVAARERVVERHEIDHTVRLLVQQWASTGVSAGAVRRASR